MTTFAHEAAPAVTVLMPVYNGAPHLREAVGSILNQTFTDFEFLIVDDGSTDETPLILGDYARKDARVRILRNETNQGIASSLNRGLKEARADLIARMDADDVSLPGRLVAQTAFMAENSDVLVSGGAMVFYETGRHHPCYPDNDTIRAALLFFSPFNHPAVIMRRAACMAAGGYDPLMVPAEDFDLWARLACAPSMRFANLPQELIRYRMHPTSDRRGYFAVQHRRAAEICKRQLQVLGLDEEQIDLESHLSIAGYPMETRPNYQRMEQWVKKLLEANAAKGIYAQEHLAVVAYTLLARHRVKFLWVPDWVKERIPESKKIFFRWLLFSLLQLRRNK